MKMWFTANCFFGISHAGESAVPATSKHIMAWTIHDRGKALYMLMLSLEHEKKMVTQYINGPGSLHCLDGSIQRNSLVGQKMLFIFLLSLY